MIRSVLFPALVVLLLIGGGCRPSSETDSVPPPAPLSEELQAAALQKGKAIVTETFSLLSSNLQAAIQTGGVSNALPFCSVAALPLTASLATKHGVTVRRATHKPRNPANRADLLESTILDHFRSHGTITNIPTPLVTNFTASTATFFAPIILNHELCLQCHGEAGRDITPENLAIIQRLYPQDEATGFQIGDLRGAWRVDFPMAALTTGPGESDIK